VERNCSVAVVVGVKLVLYSTPQLFADRELLRLADWAVNVIVRDS
jgi:hypothetical protein